MEKVIQNAIKGFEYSIGTGLTEYEEKAVRQATINAVSQFLYEICDNFRNWVEADAAGLSKTTTVNRRYAKGVHPKPPVKYPTR